MLLYAQDRPSLLESVLARLCICVVYGEVSVMDLAEKHNHRGKGFVLIRSLISVDQQRRAREWLPQAGFPQSVQLGWG